MSSTTLDTLKDPAITDALARHRSRLRDLAAGIAPTAPFRLAGISPYTEDDTVDPAGWLRTALDEVAARAHVARDTGTFRPLCVNYNPWGVHYVDKIFEADVFRLEDGGGWQVHYLDAPVGSLRMPDVDASLPARLAREHARAFLALDPPNVVLGLPTLSSALNIGVNLYGERLLVAMLEEPDTAAHDLRIIHDVILSLHRWYREHVPEERYQCIIPAWRQQLPGQGQLCGCTTQLLSPDLYRTFVADLDGELLRLYPGGGMIHLCGVHTQHLPYWAACPEVRALQVNDRAALDLELYHRALRPDQLLYVNPCDGMGVERILSITGGRRTVICAEP